MAGKHDPRFRIAKHLMKKSPQKTISAIMRQAGYKESTVNTVNNTRRQLQSVQDSAVLAMLTDLDKDGLDPASLKRTLGQVIKTGDNQEKCNAVSQMLKVILRRSDTLIDHGANVKNTINLTQNYIIPQRMNEAEWKTKFVDAPEVKK